jgi:hypothetical protein
MIRNLYKVMILVSAGGILLSCGKGGNEIDRSSEDSDTELWGFVSGSVDFRGDKFTYIFGWGNGVRRTPLVIYRNGNLARIPTLNFDGVFCSDRLIYSDDSHAVILGEGCEIKFRDHNWKDVSISIVPVDHNSHVELLEEYVKSVLLDSQY